MQITQITQNSHDTASIWKLSDYNTSFYEYDLKFSVL